jgi:hypothetical protein
MLNTKCEKCLFAQPIDSINPIKCSQGVIDKIQNFKTIIQENNFNIIQEYACRFGFAKEIYEQHQEQLKDIDLLQQIKTNAEVKYYLLLDIQPECDMNDLIDKLNNLDNKPRFISFMFRSPHLRRFTNEDKELLVSKSKIEWKSHNFVSYLSMQEGIDHILSTNMEISKSSHLLVYNSLDLDNLLLDISIINDNLLLYQKPHIAMIKNFDTLYGLFMSLENYKVAKSLNDDILEILKSESEVLQF